MKRTNGLEARTIVLTEDHVYFGGMCLSYELHMVEGAACRRFRIRVAKAEEFSEGELGCDLFRAVEYYQRVVRGTVTPCTLEDVLQDLQYA